MIDRLMRLIEGRAEPQPPSGEADLRLAVAALLVEAALMDREFGDGERQTIERLLVERYAMAEADARDLMARAEARIGESAQYFPFTNEINRQMAPAHKVAIIRMLWQVAYADGELDPHEDQLIRQVAGLIHVTDRERMLARKDALGDDNE